MKFDLWSLACLSWCKQVVHIDYGSFASLSGGDRGSLAAEYQPLTGQLLAIRRELCRKIN